MLDILRNTVDDLMNTLRFIHFMETARAIRVEYFQDTIRSTQLQTTHSSLAKFAGSFIIS